METKTDAAGRTIISICATCQKINNPGMEEFGKGIDQSVKDEMKDVDAQVKANKDKFSFSHGVCQPHMIQTLKTIPGMTEERIKSMIDKSENSVPCLLTNAPIRHAYMKGLFTPEQIQQAAQAQQQAQQNLKEYFQKMAGIKNLN